MLAWRQAIACRLRSSTGRWILDCGGTGGQGGYFCPRNQTVHCSDCLTLPVWSGRRSVRSSSRRTGSSGGRNTCTVRAACSSIPKMLLHLIGGVNGLTRMPSYAPSTTSRLWQYLQYSSKVAGTSIDYLPPWANMSKIGHGARRSIVAIKISEPLAHSVNTASANCDPQHHVPGRVYRPPALSPLGASARCNLGCQEGAAASQTRWIVREMRPFTLYVALCRL